MLNIFVTVIAIVTVVAIMLFGATTSTHSQEVDPRLRLANHFSPQPEEQTSPPSITETPLEEPAAENLPPSVNRGQRPYGAIFQLSKPVTCNDTAIVEQFITKIYKEIPITIGVARNQMAVITTIFMVYVNPRTRAFSFVEHTATGISCILAEGTELELMNNPNIIGPNFKGEDYIEQWPMPQAAPGDRN
jgi:hypothetical protein